MANNNHAELYSRYIQQFGKVPFGLTTEQLKVALNAVNPVSVNTIKTIRSKHDETKDKDPRPAKIKQILNTDEYLPLRIARYFTKIKEDYFTFSGNTARTLCDYVNNMQLNGEPGRGGKDELLMVDLYGARKIASDADSEIIESFNDAGCASFVTEMWEQSKQVYKFDHDFLEVLFSTDYCTSAENLFNYLPYETMYIDVSRYAGKYSHDLACDGMFVHVENYNGRWLIYIVALNGVKMESYCVVLHNVSVELKERRWIVYDDSRLKGLDESDEANRHRACVIEAILLILTYLASVEPDVEPAKDNQPRAKGKPAPVKKWNVGVRIGNRIRTYNAQTTNTDTRGQTGRTVRPHMRKGHWHKYRYKTPDGGYVLRPRWLHPMFVASSNVAELPAVIHESDKHSGFKLMSGWTVTCNGNILIINANKQLKFRCDNAEALKSKLERRESVDLSKLECIT